MKDAFINFREKYDLAETQFQYDLRNLADQQQRDVLRYIDNYGNFMPGYYNLNNIQIEVNILMLRFF